MRNMELAPIAPSELPSGSPEEDTLAANAVAYAEAILATHPSDEVVLERIVDDVDAGLIPSLVGIRVAQILHL